MSAAPSPTEEFDGSGLERFEALARSRRTNLRIDAERPVPDDLVERLCRLAMWAPNHKRTWPWRFVAVSGPARASLGGALAEHLARDGAAEAKVAKARGKYERAPLVLAVAAAGDDDPVVAAENRDAVAAGVQNLLLGATAAGLASYWGTGVVTEVPAVRDLCGLRPDERLVALIYLGWPVGDVPVPERPDPDLRFVRQPS
jgi:nitroreductase